MNKRIAENLIKQLEDLRDLYGMENQTTRACRGVIVDCLLFVKK